MTTPTTPTKPAKEATTPLPVLTERVEKILRNASSMIPDPPRPDAEEARICIPVTVARALADHWLRTQAEQWQPIETAPRDDWFLGWNGHWRGVAQRWDDPDPECPYQFRDESGHFIEPGLTHWRPLPDAPPQEPA